MAATRWGHVAPVTRLHHWQSMTRHWSDVPPAKRTDMPRTVALLALLIAVALAAGCTTTSSSGDGRWYLQGPTSY